MIQTEQVDIQLIARAELQHVGDEHLHADRNVAHADKAFEIGVAIDRLGDHARRVGEVDDPRVRANLLHIFYDIENHRDGAQPFKQPTRPVGLLAQVAVAQRNTLIFFTRLQLAHAQLGGDKIRALQRRTAIQRFIDLHRHAGFFHHPLAQRVDNIELLLALFHIHQPQFSDRQFMVTFQKAFQ